MVCLYTVIGIYICIYMVIKLPPRPPPPQTSWTKDIALDLDG